MTYKFYPLIFFSLGFVILVGALFLAHLYFINSAYASDIPNYPYHCGSFTAWCGMTVDYVCKYSCTTLPNTCTVNKTCGGTCSKNSDCTSGLCSGTPACYGTPRCDTSVPGGSCVNDCSACSSGGGGGGSGGGGGGGGGSTGASCSLRFSPSSGSGATTMYWSEGPGNVYCNNGAIYSVPSSGSKAVRFTRSTTCTLQNTSGVKCAAGYSMISPRAADYISQSVPTTMYAGETKQVSVTMKNCRPNGDCSNLYTWSQSGNYRLGSQSPKDNTKWGLSRVDLPVSTVAPGSSVTFTFNITAPGTPGTYLFQWRMLQESVTWFGEFTPLVSIDVVVPATLQGRFFNDLNGNGAYDAGETFIKEPANSCSGNSVDDIFVKISGLANFVSEATLCDSGGPHYRIGGDGSLVSGTYTVSTSLPPGWVQTTADFPLYQILAYGTYNLWFGVRESSISSPPLPTVTLTASPTSILSGESSTLTWSSTDAASCTASGGWSGSKPLSGSQSVSPAIDTTYVLTCTGDGGSASDSALVSVSKSVAECSDGIDNDGDGVIDAADPGCHTDGDPTNPNSYDSSDNDESNNPPGATLQAFPSFITEGQSSSLLWSCTNSIAGSIDQGVGVVCDNVPLSGIPDCDATGTTNGSKTVSPAQTTIYTLTCTGADGIATTQAKVTLQVGKIIETR